MVTVSFGQIDLSDATALDLSKAADASDALATPDDAMERVKAARAGFGAARSQLQSVVGT